MSYMRPGRGQSNDLRLLGSLIGAVVGFLERNTEILALVAWASLVGVAIGTAVGLVLVR